VSGGHSPMSQQGTFLLVAVVLLGLLMSAGPTLVDLMRAAIPLVLVVGLVAAILRLVFFHTRKW
jgi:hypothetical protein